MAVDVDQRTIERMRDRWQSFGRRDPLYYVATNRRRWDTRDFYAVGEHLAADVLNWAGDGMARERMLEIGCGAGRMLIHFAPEFRRVDGVDISEAMLDEARPHMPENVVLSVVSGASLEPIGTASLDFVLSIQVFQHVPERAVLESYLRETARVLRSAGRAVLQFDSRPASRLRRLVFALPDPVLPRDYRRYIRRYPVPQEWLREASAAVGLRVIDERAPGTADHFLLLERPARLR